MDLASRRNASAIAAGRVSQSWASVEQLPPAFDGPFDAILAVNSLGFWTAPAERLAGLRRRLTPCGRIAIAFQPRSAAAMRSTSHDAASEITDLLRAAGFTIVPSFTRRTCEVGTALASRRDRSSRIHRPA